MPTYTWHCQHCDEHLEAFMSIRSYIEDQPVYVHCSDRMERVLQPVMVLAGGDRLYQDLRASDGTDISTRSKHREYMKSRGITTIDDYSQTWKREAIKRAERLEGVDPDRKSDIVDAVHRLGG